MTTRPLTLLSEDEKIFFDAVLGYARSRVAPKVMEMDREMKLSQDIRDGVLEMGLMAIEIPEEYGGSGGTFFDSILAIEALAMVDASLAVYVDVQNTLCINAFLRWGSDEQKKTFLPKFSAGSVGAYALSEAGSGSDAFALRTKAEDKGDHYLINGSKLFITNGGEAEIFIVMANLNPEAGYRGITSFIVEKGYEGFELGAKEDKLGIRASSTYELLFEDCKVPKENVLGEIGKGYKVAIETLNEGRIGIGAQMVGIAQGAFNHAMAYIREREQFRTRICDFQGVQFQYAQMATEIEAARLMVYNAARLKEAGAPFVTQAAMAKLYSSQVAERVASVSLDLFGGVGYSKEYPAEKYFRDCKIGKIYEGTSNMQLQTIAKAVLKQHGG